MRKTSTAIIGSCGEHYVAAYLSGHNLIVAMPRAVVVEVMKECKENNESWPYFWMKKDDAEKYKGYSGFQLLNNALVSVAE